MEFTSVTLKSTNASPKRLEPVMPVSQPFSSPKPSDPVARPVSPQYGQKPQPKKEIKIEVTEADKALARTPVYDSARIKQKPLPTDIPDLTVVERHLSDEQFHEIFKMGRAAFENLPKWKKLTIKKDVGIF